MEIPEELKLNKFKLVRIPKKGEFFRNMNASGHMPVDNGTYGDASEANHQRKLDEMMQGMEYFDKLREQEEK